MDKINTILKNIKNYLLDEKAKEDELSYWLELYICKNHREIKKINPNLARFLNDDVVDICEQTEPGLEGTNFRKEIEEAYNKILEMSK